jgi:uncharacterized spore protein YtfJ
MTNLTERLAESVPSWGAKLAYGETVTLNGHDIIPVALVVFGFGGGEGSGDMPDGEFGPAKRGEGSGGGGGGYALPIGAYVGDANGATFRPNPIALAVIAVPLVAAAGLSIARIIRATQ